MFNIEAKHLVFTSSFSLNRRPHFLPACQLEAIHGRHGFAGLRGVLELDEGEALRRSKQRRQEAKAVASCY